MFTMFLLSSPNVQKSMKCHLCEFSILSMHFSESDVRNSAKLHTLAPTRLTCLRASPIITRLALCAFTLINKRLTRLCLVLLRIPLCLSAPVQKSLILCKFSVLDRKHLFWVNLAQKNQNC